MILLALNRLDDAKNVLTELQQIYPERSETYFTAGELFRLAGELDAAVTEYALAYEIAPTRAALIRSTSLKRRCAGGIIDDSGLDFFASRRS